MLHLLSAHTHPHICIHSHTFTHTHTHICIHSHTFAYTPTHLPNVDAPRMTSRPLDPNITLAIGATRTIRVTYSQGNPPASVEWRKDGVLITGPTVTTSSSETALALTNSGPEVRGRYVTVFNIGGSDTIVNNVKAECKFYGSGQLPHVTHTLLVWDIRSCSWWHSTLLM